MSREHDQREALALNLPVRLIDAVEAVAAREGRSPAQWVEAVLDAAITRNTAVTRNAAQGDRAQGSQKQAGQTAAASGAFGGREATGAYAPLADSAPVDRAVMREELYRTWAELSEIELDAMIWGWVDALRTGRDATDLLPEEAVREILGRFGLDLDTSLAERDVPRSALRKRARMAIRGQTPGSGIVAVESLGAMKSGVHGAAAKAATPLESESAVAARSSVGVDRAAAASEAEPVTVSGPRPALIQADRSAFASVGTSAFSMADVQSLESLYDAACRSWRGAGPAEEARRAGNDAIMALLRGDYAQAREAAERARDFEKAYHRGFAWSTFWQRVHNETMGRMMAARPVGSKAKAVG